MREYISPPQAFRGTEAEKLDQAYRYLFRLSEQLNSAVDEVDQKSVTVQGQAASVLKQTEKTSADLAEQYTSLKSLIIKTADIVSSEMEVLKSTLESNYAAISSEWGEYQKKIKNDITTTAEGLLQEYEIVETLTSLQDKATDFSTYKISTQGYIRQGIIGYKDNLPIIGIAIGQDLSVNTITIDGEEIEETVDINGNKYPVFKLTDVATYTSSKITFWQNGVEAGSFSSGELVVNNAIRLGNWQLSSNNFALTWIGGPVS